MIQGTYYKEWSTVLNREMEFKVYGSAGVPVLALPARGGRFFDWENNGMPDAIAQLLNEGKIQLFRPDCNANRFNDSADRLGMPPIPPEDFVQAVKTLVDVDRDWVPHSDGASLYIRPFCIATDVGLGVHAAKHYRFAIICAPSGAYYAEGLDPVRIYVDIRNVIMLVQ